MSNPFCHMSLVTSDLQGAKGFYGELFGWKFSAPEGMSYTFLDTGKEPGGGMAQRDEGENTPIGWTSFVAVEDLTDTLSRAKGLGAKVIQDKTEVPEYGWMALISDPQGAPIGLWQDA